jgi:hypothetical protein
MESQPFGDEVYDTSDMQTQVYDVSEEGPIPPRLDAADDAELEAMKTRFLTKVCWFDGNSTLSDDVVCSDNLCLRLSFTPSSLSLSRSPLSLVSLSREHFH